MGKQTGTINDPHFITSQGIDLTLKPIGPVVIRRWDIEYKKQNPEPQPPVTTLENGQKVAATNDPEYQRLKEKWESDFLTEQYNFIFAYGVRTGPPDDWEYPFPFDVKDEDPKLLWLETILLADDLEGLAEAILSITVPTETAIESAAKN